MTKKRLVALGLACVMAFSMMACGSNEEAPAEEKAPEVEAPAEEPEAEAPTEEPEEAPEETTAEVSADDFISEIKEVVPGGIGTDDTLDDVAFDGDNLVITVTLSEDRGALAGLDDAEYFDAQCKSRFGSITDNILELDPKYDELWNTMTVVFPGAGKVWATKDELTEGDFGRYFEPAEGDYSYEPE